MALELLTQFAIFSFSVVSGSMSPTLNVGDTFTIDTTVNMDQLKENDIILFYAPTDFDGDGVESAILHRIVDIEYDDGVVEEITTKGDNPQTNTRPIEGVDLTDDLDRETLLQLYIGKASIGGMTEEHMIKLNQMTTENRSLVF